MLTQAIKMGMTPYEFWHDEPSLYFNYLDAYEEKQKIEKDKIEITAWLQGKYNQIAFASVSPFVEDVKYPKQPFGFEEENKSEVEMSEEERLEFEQQLAIDQFEQFGKYAEMYNNQYFEEEEG